MEGREKGNGGRGRGGIETGAKTEIRCYMDMKKRENGRGKGAEGRGGKVWMKESEGMAGCEGRK